MSWLRIDDQFPEHAKVEALMQIAGKQFGNCIALWLFASCYASRNLTDGFVPLRYLNAALRNRKSCVKATQMLIEVGLWEALTHGIKIHDYLGYNPSKTEKEAEKRRNTERKRRQREGAGHSGTSSGRHGGKFRSPAPTPSSSKEEHSDFAPNRRVGSGSEEGSKAVLPKNPSEQITKLENRYEPGLAVEARETCALSRRNGKMSDSVWLKTLNQLASHPVPAVEEGIRIFLDKHGDGEKREEYLLGIVRRLAREKPEERKSRPSDPLDSEFTKLHAELNSGAVTEERRHEITARLNEIAAIKQSGCQTSSKASLAVVAGGTQ